jgi:hypothetical protein
MTDESTRPTVLPAARGHGALRSLKLFFGSPEFLGFVAVWALQYIGFWVTANLVPLSMVYGLGYTGSKQVVHPPPVTQVPPVGAPNSPGAIVTVATHPILLHFVLTIFTTNLVVMLLESIPFFGLVFGEYIMVKVGATVNYIAWSTHIYSGSSTYTLTPLALSGALLGQPFYYLETFAYAASCSAGLLGGVTLFRPTRRRLAWYLGAIGLSAALLFVAALLEATFILHFN